MATITKEKRKVPSDIFVGDPGGGGNGGGSWGSGGESLPISSAQLGMWLFLGAVTMLFAGFTSAYIIHSSADTWRPLPMPRVLWFNTVLLLVSSVTIELARAAFRHRRAAALKGWLSITTLAGVGFLAGQLTAWRQLVHAGVYLPSNPHSSFFYILTGIHGLHLLGGVGALFYVLFRVWTGHNQRLRSLKLSALYWHFMDVLWIYLFVLFFAM
jgi:cytochrome c oxidase subunit 3